MRRRCLVAAALLLLSSCGGGGSAGTGGPDDERGDDRAAEVSADGLSSKKCTSNLDCDEGFCSPVTGECVECTVDPHCEQGKKCISGQCVGDLVCEPGRAKCNGNESETTCNSVGTAWMEPVPCDDGLDCTVDSCVGGSGCLNSPDNAACDDDNDCTGDECDLKKGCVNDPLGECGGGIADPSPATLSFPPTVPGGAPSSKNLLLSNSGLDGLLIFKAAIDGDASFFVLSTAEEPLSEVTFDPPVEVAPGDAASLTVLFEPDQLGEHNGTLQVYTSDPTKSGGVVAVLLLGKGVADNCISADPQSLAFGSIEVGVLHTEDVKIKNCGDGLIPIYDVELSAEGSDEFSLVAVLSPPFDLDVGQTTTITVGVKPTMPGQVYSGQLLVKNGSPKTPELLVPLSAEGSSGTAVCPIAVISYAGGEDVPPLEPLELSAKPSYGLSEVVTKWSWSVEAPAGAYPAFTPSADAQIVGLTPTVCGQYAIHLTVQDAAGHGSCNTASTLLKVAPEQDLYVELIWTTPGDVDQSDVGAGKGADVDLHFASPLAAGPDVDGDGAPDGWFDKVFDCYSQNPSPEWGSEDDMVKDDPVLLVADADGAGPESIGVGKPATGVYKIGVHYAQDFGLGKSSAKIAVYGKEGIVHVTDYVDLSPGDLWSALLVNVTVTAVFAEEVFTPAGKRVVTPSYPVPK